MQAPFNEPEGALDDDQYGVSSAQPPAPSMMQANSDQSSTTSSASSSRPAAPDTPETPASGLAAQQQAPSTPVASDNNTGAPPGGAGTTPAAVSPRNPFETHLVAASSSTAANQSSTPASTTPTAPSTIPSARHNPRSSERMQAASAVHSEPRLRTQQQQEPHSMMVPSMVSSPTLTTPEKSQRTVQPLSAGPHSPSPSVGSSTASPNPSPVVARQNVENPFGDVPTLPFHPPSNTTPNQSPVPPRQALQQQHPGHSPPLAQRQQQQPLPQHPALEDDETTEPSSAGNSSQQQPPPPPDPEPMSNHKRTRSFGAVVTFLDKTRQRITSRGHVNSNGSDDEDMMDVATESGVLIAGYLQKLGRNGKWQTRWFETDGECLSYYKSRQRSKLMATLDLEKVGEIVVDHEDESGQTFTIQVLGRLYVLRAGSRVSCSDWVITLNRVKEARMHQGHIKLVSDRSHASGSASNPAASGAEAYHTTMDLLDSHQPGTPRVVVVANRQRTRAVAESEDFDSMMEGPDLAATAPPAPTLVMQQQGDEVEATYGGLESGQEGSSKRISTIGTVVLARWTKRKSSMSRLRAKFATWARSLRKYRCTSIESQDVVLDRHVHPPGHDDQKRQHTKKMNAAKGDPSSNQEGLSGWIGKETSNVSGQRTTGDPPLQPGRPQVPLRSISTTSDGDARMLS